VKRKIGPGRFFWVGTFAVGLASPTRGKRRVNDKMKRMDAEWAKAQKRIGALEEELVASYAENKRLTKDLLASREACNDHRKQQDDAALANEQSPVTTVAPARQDAKPGKRILKVRDFRNLDAEETIPLPKAVPGGIQVRRLAEKAAPSDVPGLTAPADEVG
jgi:hypothetical protein